MDLSVRQVARLLDVSEETVHRWLRDKAIPAHRLHDQSRFNRVEIQEWAAAQGVKLAPEPVEPGSSSAPPSLRRAIELGGVHVGVSGRTPEEVLGAVSLLPGIPDGVDRAFLRELLISREALTSTGIGEGIAVPHPRDPLVMHVAEPVALACFLQHPVDFHALDGVPVRVLFTILSPTVRSHLQVLSRLSYALHDPALHALLQRPGSASELLGRLGEIERAEGRS
jgi:PTS system nitrogen regulatory IIA component